MDTTDTSKFGTGQVEVKINGNDFCETFQIDALKREPSEIAIFTKFRNFCTSSSNETKFVDHKHATDNYQEYQDQEQNEEKLDVRNLNLEDFRSKFFEDSLTSTVQIKKEDVVIFYDDIKRETDEKKSSESIRFCEVCYQSYGGEVDFFKSTNYESECSCQKQNESPFNNIHSEDVKPYTFNIHGEDVKPSSLEPTTDLGLQPLEVKVVKDEVTSGDKATKEQDNDDEMKHKFSSTPLENDQSVAEKIIQCNMCPKFFRHRANFKVHERGHTGEKPYCCKLCFKSFTCSSNLKVHERIHTGEKSFHCNFCSKSFTQKGNLKLHEQSHTSDKRFQCKTCPKAFTNASHLRVHERIHSGEKPFQCKICFKAFIDSSYLRVHERIHTGEKSFHCKVCSKSFHQLSNLKVHARVHTGERPFRCNNCPKAFSNSSLLKIHERNHSGEKPFHCKICSKDFTTCSLLRIHGRIHTGEKFHCRICSKSFSQKGNLKIHERGQHS